MFLEHIVYSSAIALLVGLVAIRLHRRDYSWIIVVFAFAPDVDVMLTLVNGVLRRLFHAGISFPIHTLHAQLHTLGALAIFTLVLAFVLALLGIPVLTGILYTSLAYGAHLFEDALVYSQGYPLLWPLYSQNIGIGILGPYELDFFGIANVRVLLLGLILLVLAVMVRIYYEYPRFSSLGVLMVMK
jgi:hypothetical protein